MRRVSPAIILLSASVIQPSLANEQQLSNGFTEDSHLTLLIKNAMINRNYIDHGVRTRREWGQGIIGTYSSGFTQGRVGFGIDALGQYALRLDGGRGRSGAGGIDYFEQKQNGQARKYLAKAGVTAKLRWSNTLLSYGTQQPTIPLLTADQSRLLSDTYTGFMLDSKEFKDLDITAGYFTAEQRKSSNRYNSGLSSISFGGAKYQFNSYVTASAYASHIAGIINKQSLSATYTQPFTPQQSMVWDFLGYNSRLTKDYAKTLVTGRSNTIWSLSASYIYRIHTFKVAYQQSDGSTGYHYGWYQNQDGLGDNGIWLSNSYWSDFNGQGERSWQAAYSIDLAGLGVPGLRYDVAYVTANNIKTSATSNGKEHEFFNQLQYKFPSGVAKDLQLAVRYSVLRVSADAAEYNRGGSDLRLIAQYPLSLF